MSKEHSSEVGPPDAVSSPEPADRARPLIEWGPAHNRLDLGQQQEPDQN